MTRFTRFGLLVVLALVLTTGPASAQSIGLNYGAADSSSTLGSPSPSSMNFNGTFAYNPANTAYNDVLWVIIPVADAPNLSTATNASYGFAAGSWDGHEMIFNFDGVFQGLPGVYLPPSNANSGLPSGGILFGPTKTCAIYLANLSPVGAGSLHPYWQCYYLNPPARSLLQLPQLPSG